ncbi:MAG: hypothetical protein J7L04_11340 [Bacteroidales bacterium]|nr:hypothetical protein [Bacteroidales bacterium]
MTAYLKVKTLLFYLIFFTSINAQTLPVMPSRGICAHRGAMDTHPENTLSAFKEAVRLGVQMIELDVRLTKDEQLVILHDKTVNRTTNGQGEISDLTLTQVKELDAGSWKSNDFKDERIPTLEEALAVIPANVWINVHLKGGKRLGEKVASVLVKEKKIHQAFLACGREAAEGAHLVFPDILICNMDRQDSTEEYIDLTMKFGSEFIQLYKIEPDEGIEIYTAKLKQKGVKINYCCTDNPGDMKKLFDYGVDFVLVNQVARMMHVADSLGVISY